MAVACMDIAKSAVRMAALAAFATGANRNSVIQPGSHSVSESPSLIDSAKSSTPSAAVCPYCALLCDDLALAPKSNQGFTITRNGCRRASQDFARAPLVNTPRVAGRETTLDAAVRAAARLLKRSRQPLFGGLATDVDGMRAAIDLADAGFCD